MASDNAAAVLSKATGSVYVERQGTRASLTEGDTIRSTDTVITDLASTAEIRFTDGSTASLSPATTLEIKDFSFGPGAEPSFILNLAEGTMRSVSGELVRQNPEAFKIVTPQATVGIRGTELFTAVMSGGQEVHAVLHIGKGHIVTLTSHDGRSVVMDTALQAVNMSDGEHGSLVKQTFKLNELQQIIKSIAPSQVQAPIQPSGPEAGVEAGPVGDAAQGDAAQAVQTAQAAQAGQGDAASTTSSSTSATIVILHEGESATSAQATTLGNTASTSEETLIAVIEQLQGALADAGFNVLVGSGNLESALSQGKSLSDVTIIETVKQSVSQVIDKPAAPQVRPDPAPDSLPDSLPDPVPPPVVPPVVPPVEPPVEPPVNPSNITYTGDITSSIVVAADKGQGIDQALHITVTGDVDSGGELIANSSDLTSTGTSAGVSGGDTIIVNGDVQGLVYGDSKTVTLSGGSVRETLGNDTITAGSMSAGAIYGDSGKTQGTDTLPSNHTLTCGNDTITVGNMSGGIIFGDIDDITVGREILLGNDTIIIGGVMTDGKIFGDFSSQSSGGVSFDTGTAQNPHGSDTITIRGGIKTVSSSFVHVSGGVGDDTIKTGTIDARAGGQVYIEGGSDTDNITTGIITTGATGVVAIAGNAGTDTIRTGDITTTGGTVTIEGGDGADTITVGSITAAGSTVTISGGIGGDTITVDSMSGGLIVGDIGRIGSGAQVILGDDIITVNGVMSGGEIYGDYKFYNGVSSTLSGGADNISVLGGITVATGNKVLINGNVGNDTITTGNVDVTGGGLVQIYGEDDTDIITIASIKTGVDGEVLIDGGIGQDNITITAGIDARASGKTEIKGGAGNDTITTGDITTGVDGNVIIDGGDGVDWITAGAISTLAGGTVEISGGAGNDTITTDAITTGVGGNVTIDGGTGNDTITTGIITAAGGNVTISGGEGADTLIVGGHEGTGSLTINLGVGSTVDSSVDKLTMDLATVNSDVTITGYTVSTDPSLADIIKLQGLDSKSIRYGAFSNAAGDNDSFNMIYNNGDKDVTITITGDFGDGITTAAHMYAHLLNQLNPTP